MLTEIEGEETTDLEASYSSSSSSFPESENPLEPLRDCHVLILCFDLSRPYTYKVRNKQFDSPFIYFLGGLV